MKNDQQNKILDLNQPSRNLKHLVKKMRWRVTMNCICTDNYQKSIAAKSHMANGSGFVYEIRSTMKKI
jgi:hypothetical protein